MISDSTLPVDTNNYSSTWKTSTTTSLTSTRTGYTAEHSTCLTTMGSEKVTEEYSITNNAEHVKKDENSTKSSKAVWIITLILCITVIVITLIYLSRKYLKRSSAIDVSARYTRVK